MKIMPCHAIFHSFILSFVIFLLSGQQSFYRTRADMVFPTMDVWAVSPTPTTRSWRTSRSWVPEVPDHLRSVT